MATTLTHFDFPAHVPVDLRWDHSMAEYAHEGDDPFLAVSRLHEGPDIFYARDATQGRPGWVITRHVLQQEAFVDYEHFTSEGQAGLNQLLGVEWHLAPLEYDPPAQVEFRKVINPYFTPKEINSMGDAVRETCDRLIAKFEDNGGCEFIEDFAVPFPTYIFLSLVGLPVDEAPQFLQWEASMLRAQTMEERITAHIEVMHYLQTFIQEQRKNPTNRIIDGIIKSKLGDRPITDDEVLGLLYTFYLGGLDTVYSTLGFIMRHLALYQDLQQRLRNNPELINDAVDEFCRAFSVVSTSRMVAKDFTFHGVEMKRGELVLMPLFLAGRDPMAWENPHEIDLNRKPSALAFASGPHLCVGRHLARRELRIALQSFLSRFDNIHIPRGETCSYHSSSVYGMDRLPLAWTRQK